MRGSDDVDRLATVPHYDILGQLNAKLTLTEKLGHIHSVLRRQMPEVDRVSMAIYDPITDVLRTFAYSGDRPDPLPHLQAKLAETPALRAVADSRQPRVIGDLDAFGRTGHPRAAQFATAGYRSSYTLPFYADDHLAGFVFFNSARQQAFPKANLGQLDLFGHLISLTLLNEQNSVRTLTSVVQAARDLAHHRDSETGEHIARTAHYARLIARELADDHGFDDELIEHIFLFASLHDVGKIAVPDAVLRKEGSLAPDEEAVMRTHTVLGRQIVDAMVADFGLQGIERIDVLRNIAELHHETMDGHGYPYGLRGDEIPVEARIVAVADVFDALSTSRPYKDAYTVEHAFEILMRLAEHQLDGDCVDALIRNRSEVEAIRTRFSDSEVSNEPAQP